MNLLTSHFRRGVSPRHVRQMMNMLLFWREQMDGLTDLTVSKFDDDRQNIFRVIHRGLQVEMTAPDSAELVPCTFKLIEQRGYWGEWIPLLEIAAQTTDDPLLRLRLFIQLGTFHRINGNIHAAIEIHLDAAHQAKQIDTPEELFNAYTNLGLDYWEAHDYQQAQHYAEQAESLSDQLPEGAETLKAALISLFGMSAYAQGDYENARDHFVQALPLFERNSQVTYQARTLTNIGRTCEALQRYQEALDAYDEAIQILEKIGNELDKSFTLINRGTVFYRMQRWEEAISSYRGADSDYLQRSGHIRYRAMIMTNIGDVLLRQEKLQSAEMYLQDGVNLWRLLKDDIMLANAVGTLGETIGKQDRIRQAVHHFDEALELLARHPDNAWGQKLQQTFAAQRTKLTTKDHTFPSAK